MSVETSRKATSAKLASEAWVAMLQFFFVKGRPQMLELWREFDLMPPQQMVLGLLDEPRPMGELAQQMHCDNSNITGIVDRLEAAGLAERRPHERDRRVKAVVLTAKGERMQIELDRRAGEPPPPIAALSPEDALALRDILSRAIERG
jgi:DNA-binding MarR family transcriptional regulator